jgi:hypothetical protein
MDISRFFWEELYWLYCYFNRQYNDENDKNEYGTFNGSEDEYDIFDASEEQSYDFITFVDHEDEIDPYARHPRYIAKPFKCNFIHCWIKYKLKREINADVDTTLMMDIKHVGEMLPTIMWKADGLILPLFGTKYYHLIEGSIQSLVNTYTKERVEYLICGTVNDPFTEQFSPNTFWQQQFRNCSNDVHNVEGTRNQLLDLLDIFKWHGLNILTLEQVRNNA